MAAPEPTWDNEQALREGWDLFWTDADHASGLLLQRLEDPQAAHDAAALGLPAEPVFADDAHALAFVRERALSGSTYHRNALACCALLGLQPCVLEPASDSSASSVGCATEGGVLTSPPRDHHVLQVIGGLTANPTRPSMTMRAAETAAQAINDQPGAQYVLAVSHAQLLAIRRADLAKRLVLEHRADDRMPSEAEPLQLGQVEAFVVDAPAEPVDSIRTVRLVWAGRQFSLLVDLHDPSTYPDEAFLSDLVG